MSVKKIANAAIQEPVLDRLYWEKLHGKRAGQGVSKIAAKVNTSKFLLSHCTIMASVAVEKDADWLIRPECSHLVNNNYDAWTNEVLQLSYKSFCGAFNFVEHYQNTKAKKGYILDSVLRKIVLSPDDDVWVYYCDILVATDLRHEQLVSDIRSGKVRYMSMGCVTDRITCSYCGKYNGGEGPACTHLTDNFKGRYLTDEDGIPRRVAELCGHKSLPNGGVKFVEASWVATPAFPGAANRKVYDETLEINFSTFEGKTASGNLGKLKVASANALPNPRTEQQHVAAAELRRLR